MITFVYGPSGSGKTHYIFEKLRENTQNAILLVPEQQTVTAERKALDALPASAGTDFEVLNFSRLCNTVFRKYGGLSYRYITPSMKSLFMWRTMLEVAPLLKEYHAVAKEISMTDVMLKAVEELKICSVSQEKIDDFLKEPSDEAVCSKLHDLDLINATYSALVADSFDDKSEDIVKLSELLREHPFFDGKQVFIDSFTSFTAQEYRIIEHIFRQAENVTVTLGCESPNVPLISNESICETAKDLTELAKKAHKRVRAEYLTENHRAKNEELRHLFADFWKPKKDVKLSDVIKEEDRGNVKLYHCLDSYEEADAVAAIINREIRNGLRYKDIAVIARDASKYEGIIDAALEAADIPYYMSTKNDVSSSPAVKFLLSAVRINYLGFRTEDVLAHIKTNLCGISLKDADMFEKYVNTWSISGNRFKEDAWGMNADGYTSRKSARGEKIKTVANTVREKLIKELGGFFAELENAENASDMAKAIYYYLVNAKINEALANAAEEEKKRNNNRAAADHIAIWNVIMGILDDINIALGDKKITVEELYRILVIAFGNAEVGSIPTGYDEVTIGSASLIRADNIKCAILIGANEGVFPASVKENGFFTDYDRSVLRSKGITLSADSKKRSSEELLFANRALTLPSDKLYVLYSKADAGGSKLRPSMIVTRLQAFFDYWPKEPKIFSTSDMIFSTESAVQNLPFITDGTFKTALEEELKERNVDTSPKPISDPDCNVSPETAAAFFGDRMALTQSKIDKYVNCPFSYYCNFVLELHPDEKANVDSRVAGTFVHEVLEKVLCGAVTEDGLQLDKLEDSIDSVIEGIIASICTDDQKNSNRLNHLFLRLRRLSMLLISCLKNEFSKSTFTPRFFELKIGTNGVKPLKLTLSDGSEVSLYGTVDRVDVWKNYEDVYVRVVDYKTGDKKFSLSDVEKGLDLQLLIYLFTLCRPDTGFAENLGCANGKAPIPAGANYLSSKVNIEKYSDIPSREKALLDAEGRIDKSGIFLDDDALDGTLVRPKKGLMQLEDIEEIKRELERTITRIAEAMRSGNAEAKPIEDKESPCKYCEMASICRAKKISY